MSRDRDLRPFTRLPFAEFAQPRKSPAPRWKTTVIWNHHPVRHSAPAHPQLRHLFNSVETLLGRAEARRGKGRCWRWAKRAAKGPLIRRWHALRRRRKRRIRRSSVSEFPSPDWLISSVRLATRVSSISNASPLNKDYSPRSPWSL